jgi:hypothetical protein
VEWAKGFISTIHAEKLRGQEINGTALLEMTKIDLERMLQVAKP